MNTNTNTLDLTTLNTLDTINVIIDTDTIVPCLVVTIDYGVLHCLNNTHKVDILTKSMQLVTSDSSYKIDKIEKVVPITRRVVITNKIANYNNID